MGDIFGVLVVVLFSGFGGILIGVMCFFVSSFDLVVIGFFCFGIGVLLLLLLMLLWGD